MSGKIGLIAFLRAEFQLARETSNTRVDGSLPSHVFSEGFKKWSQSLQSGMTNSGMANNSLVKRISSGRVLTGP